MTDEQRVVNVIEWADAGTGEVIRASNAVRDSVIDTTRKINDANDALGGLNTQIGDMPSFAPPPMPIPFDDEGVKDAAKSIEKVSESALDAGKASDMLFNALDNVIPGLGGLTESLFSMNPLAIAGTAAIVGLTLVLGEMERQAEEARAAGEAMAKAESDRVLAEITLADRTNLATAGNKAAREKILTDLAEYTAAKDDLEQRGIENSKNIAEQLKIINDLDNDTSQATTLEETKRRIEARRQAQGALDGFDATAKDLASQMETVGSQFTLLTDAAKELGVTQAELNAINLAGTQGTEGAVAALEKLWTAGDGFAKLGDVAENVFGKIKDFGMDALKLAEAQAEEEKKIAEERAKAEERLLDITARLTDVEMDRGKVLADRFIEEQRAKELGVLETRLAAAQEYDAAVAKNTKIADIQKQANTAEIEAQSKFFESQQKLLANYLKSEKEATEDYSLQRVRALEDMYAQLSNLASQRDVAGFVNARASGMTNLGRNDQDFGIEAQRRKASYEQAAQEQVAAYAKENTARQQQLQQRLQQEQQAGQQAVKQADIVNKQIADLRAQYAAQDLRARRASEDATYRQTVDVLQRKRSDELKITAGAAAGVVDIVSKMRDAVLRIGSSIGQGAARGIPRFDEGTPMITRTGLAVVHAGERVMSPAENARFMRGGGSGQMGPVTINMSVGEFATPSQVAAVEQRIVAGIQRFASNGS
jgi:hypothetical protein